MDNYEAEIEDASHEDLIKKFNTWDKAIDAHWGGWRDEAEEAYEVTAGRQWDKDAEEDAASRRLTTIVLNKVDSTVSAICGSEMTNRQEVRYYPREASTRGPDGRLSDVAVNEILTSAAEWTRDECDAADEESEAFRDTLICGLGFTETRMDYEGDAEGMAVVERVDPLEMAIDPSARRPNAVDARYKRRRKPFPKSEAIAKFGIDAGDIEQQAQTDIHHNYAGSAYQDRGVDAAKRDEVIVTEYQWFDLEDAWIVRNPDGNTETLTADEYEKLASKMPQLEEVSVKIKARKYKRAFRVANKILEVTDLPDGEFTYKAITGKFDRNRGVWYGVVRAMIEPQRLLNKQVSQVQRIVDTTAKGGLLAETEAFEDPEEALDSWSASDSIVWTKPGAIRNGAIQPKPISSYPSGIDKLLAIANEAVPGVSGVNNEMLGQIDREQAGVVDIQRKEAAYGVLKAFFNSLSRYKRMHGRHLLKLITKYMSDGRLVRVVGNTGAVQYLPLVRQEDTLKYDVIVDEAASGPNQKDKVFSFLVSMMPMLRSMNLPPQVLMKLIEYSPLPSSLIQEVQEEVRNLPPQQNPEMQKREAEAQKFQSELQQKQQAAQLDAQMEIQKLQAKQQAEADAARANLALRREEAQAELQIQRERAEMEMQLARERMEFEKEMAVAKFTFEAELAAQKSNTEAAVEMNGVDPNFGGQLG